VVVVAARSRPSSAEPSAHATRPSANAATTARRLRWCWRGRRGRNGTGQVCPFDPSVWERPGPRTRCRAGGSSHRARTPASS
jgi:hypothetical protein